MEHNGSYTLEAFSSLARCLLANSTIQSPFEAILLNITGPYSPTTINGIPQTAFNSQNYSWSLGNNSGDIGYFAVAVQEKPFSGTPSVESHSAHDRVMTNVTTSSKYTAYLYEAQNLIIAYAIAISALENLEEAEQEKRRKNGTQKKRTPKARPKSLPPPNKRQTPATPTATTPRTEYATSLREPSPAPSSRRISFAEPDRPSVASRRLWIPTRKNNLASGFAFDPRLQKYGVPENEWTDFSNEIVQAAEIPGHPLMWPFRKKEVIKKIKKELQYDGGLKKKIRVWNRLFKSQGFQTEMALPGEMLEENIRVVEDGEPLSANVKRDGKRFRMVVTPNAEKASSVYSRTSSLTRSTTQEGIPIKKKENDTSPQTSMIGYEATWWRTSKKFRPTDDTGFQLRCFDAVNNTDKIQSLINSNEIFFTQETESNFSSVATSPSEPCQSCGFSTPTPSSLKPSSTTPYQICYAYLGDVSAIFPTLADSSGLRSSVDTPKRSIANLESTPFYEDFKESRWFTRGWTLQELIAPRNVLFFNKEPVLHQYCEENVMGIGKEDHLSRRSCVFIAWRRSSRSLLITLYSHGAPTTESPRFGGILASSPAAFRSSQNIVQLDNPEDQTSYSITNRGLQIRLRVKCNNLSRISLRGVAVLNCRYEGNFEGPIGVNLATETFGNRLGWAEYDFFLCENVPTTNTASRLCIIPLEILPSLESKDLSISTRPFEDKTRFANTTCTGDPKLWLRLSKDPTKPPESTGFAVIDVYPRDSWNKKTNAVELPSRENVRIAVTLRSPLKRLFNLMVLGSGYEPGPWTRPHRDLRIFHAEGESLEQLYKNQENLQLHGGLDSLRLTDGEEIIAELFVEHIMGEFVHVLSVSSTNRLDAQKPLKSSLLRVLGKLAIDKL
ncbi:hypothetical protein G7Y89_g14447 [Cudoniella acicularis]|uniref:Heterokaryon incompatibility domain-containing protein n=1 Tax=Cudoniella acicularis TaxID=354080 RepID=A0A8H4VT82_9HELO|nr:hypothetical protein G7Y89_g14447 [Cudoniella acicularis]